MNKIKVLLIDDDEDDFIIAKDIFKEINQAQKYELHWVDTFEKGIYAALKNQFDIYLVDYRLGKQTGLDLINEAILSGIKEPFIILTGKGDYQIDQDAMNIGAADYLVKDGLTAATLERALRYALKQAQNTKALKESEQKFRSLFEKSREAILISDFNGNIHGINPAGLKLFAYTEDVIKHINDRSLFQNPEDRNSFVQELETKGAVNNFECNMVSSNGQIYFCSLSSFLEIDTINMIEVYHTIIHDITERKNQETRSIFEKKILLSEHIAKGFAEEIRNPISTINLILHELSTDEQLAYIETLQVNLEEIKLNLDSINNLTKNFIESTETKPLEKQKININKIINDALLDITDLITGHRIIVEKDLLPKPTILALDVKQIKESLINILKNAVEGMESYPKVINISTIKDSGYFSIFIEDNGDPIPQDFEDKLFEPFFTTKKDAEGLGLPTAERIILAHNGKIFYKRQLQGNLFVIQLPL